MIPALIVITWIVSFFLISAISNVAIAFIDKVKDVHLFQFHPDFILAYLLGPIGVVVLITAILLFGVVEVIKHLWGKIKFPQWLHKLNPKIS